MFNHSADHFLTIETGEAYQPVRLTYLINDVDKLLNDLNKLQCIKKDSNHDIWLWLWNNESSDLNFQTIDTLRDNQNHSVQLAKLNIQHNFLHIYLPSFKRACIAVRFFHRVLSPDACRIQHADFLNKLFRNNNENLPSRLDNLFKDDETLNQTARGRTAIYEEIEKQCQNNLSMSDALDLVADVIKSEAKWKLPEIERFIFDFSEENNPQVIFLVFYLFMRSRELVALKRASGQYNYKLADAANEIIEQTFAINSNDKTLNPIFFRAQALFRGHVTHGSVNVFC